MGDVVHRNGNGLKEHISSISTSIACRTTGAPEATAATAATEPTAFAVTVTTTTTASATAAAAAASTSTGVRFHLLSGVEAFCSCHTVLDLPPLTGSKF